MKEESTPDTFSVYVADAESVGRACDGDVLPGRRAVGEGPRGRPCG